MDIREYIKSTNVLRYHIQRYSKDRRYTNPMVALRVRNGEIFKLVVWVLDVRKAHKYSPVVLNDIPKIADYYISGGTRRDKICRSFKIVVWILNIRKAHKKYINLAQLRSMISQKQLMLRLAGDSTGSNLGNSRNRGSGLGYS